jgi:hypothetical protein
VPFFTGLPGLLFFLPHAICSFLIADTLSLEIVATALANSAPAAAVRHQTPGPHIYLAIHPCMSACGVSW